MTRGETSASSGAGAPTPAYSDGYRYYVLGLLFTVYVFNFVDRQVLAILFQPIKEELGLTDTQLGFMGGFAFALFYTAFGLPIAAWADRGMRRSILAGALAVWSVMTALSGLATGFATLLLARIGVGVGEAGGSPPSHSLISDYFPPETRATALSVYSLGIPVGILLGYLLGGWINEFYGWRMAFFVIGAPGVVLAVIVRLTLREPPRGYSEGLQDTGHKPPLLDVVKTLWGRRSFRHLAVAAGLHSFVGYGFGQWVPSFLIRSHGMSTGEIGSWLALIYGVTGAVGVFAGGYIADRLAARTGDRRWYMWVSAIAIVIAIPFVIAGLLAPTKFGALGLFFPATLFAYLYLGPTFAMTQSMVAPRMRAVASAILLFILNLIGLGLGPLAVGKISDVLADSLGNESLRYALIIVVAVNIWSAYHYFRAARTLRRDLDAGAL